MFIDTIPVGYNPELAFEAPVDFVHYHKIG